MTERRYVTRGALQRSLCSNAVSSSSDEEGNLSPSDKDYFKSFEVQDDNNTNTKVRTVVLYYDHYVKWMIRGYSITPINTVIDGPVINKIRSSSIAYKLRIAFEKKENELHLIFKSASSSYCFFQTKILLRDIKENTLYEEGFGPSYFIRDDEKVDLIVSNKVCSFNSLFEDVLTINLKIKFKAVHTRME
ncbi:hypothetical protein TNCT_623001 [Trichonephila clavata]|uniref:Uncharacterized protein n=1 Tax=Trichonephila clavata TaxID=2740835 RepID=A0A8X6L0N0_TRICU|nr:hypothetical protein TNCT_623001 [Trichonephila clavata]